MQLTATGGLSHRGEKAQARYAQMAPLFDIMKDLWDPETNPDGFISLGVAENVCFAFNPLGPYG